MLKRLTALLALTCVTPVFAQQTDTAPRFAGPVDYYVNMGPPRQYQGPVYVNSYRGAGPLAGTWARVDLRPLGLPASAIAADLRGLLIITGASGNSEIADLGLIFRAIGDTTTLCAQDFFSCQATYQTNFLQDGLGAWKPVLGGQRSNMQAIVPLTNGQFEFCWTRSTGGNWPVNSSYGVNLSVQGYYVPRDPSIVLQSRTTSP